MSGAMNVTNPHFEKSSVAGASGGAPAAAGQGSPRPGPGFSLVSDRPVPVLKLRLQQFRHRSGAEHFHLACDDEHRAFMVSFRTVPEDSTGLPHILEHLVLCGSERFPVRDPFFMMLRRSLNTFMNAMTGGDATYYPFATQVPKDFDNLLSIYLDAVFRPNLNPLDFAQEGFRIEPAEAPAAKGQPAPVPADPADWAFKGVVYNEMKGARANTDGQMWQAISATVAPETPYRFDAGGDPAVIPALEHADLVAFHRRHYCAANACITSYGALDIETLHARLAPYLEEPAGALIELPAAQPPLREPRTVEVPVPLESGQDPRDVSLARLVWLWHDRVDLQTMLLGDLMDHLLLGHAGAPLRLALESSGLGRSLSGSGFDTLGRNGMFAVGLKGMDPADYPHLQPLVMRTLDQVIAEGFAAEEVEAALHQLELARRRIGGDRLPFGLDLSLRATEAWMRGLDPLDLLDIEPELERLRERIAAPGFWQRALAERLLDNPHRALLLARPDLDFNARQAREERERLDARMAGLDAPARSALVDQALRLAKRQATPDDPELLPDLALSDVPAEQRWAEGRLRGPGLTVFETGTNGILHQVVALPVGGLGADDLMLLPLLAQTIGELGVGGRDYRAQAGLLNAVCGGISAWLDLRGDRDDARRVWGYLFVEIYGLARASAEFNGLVAETLAAQRFDEQGRLRELLEQSLSGLQQRVQWSGHDLAEVAAARGFGGRAGLGHDLGGLGRLAWLKDRDARVRAGEPVIAELAGRLADLLGRLRRRPVSLALIGDAAGEAEPQAEALRAWEGWSLAEGFLEGQLAVAAPRPAPAAPTAFTTATQVNYCAAAFPAVPLGHADAPALAVASRYLTFNFLHPRLREQGGAYGGRAGFNGSTGLFAMTSYRDPRLADTLADMKAGALWLREIDEDPRLLREAILGVIGGLDRPGSPAGEGRRRFVSDLVGYGPEVMNDYRRRVLAVTPADIRRVAERWLDPEKAGLAVITSEAELEASGLDWARSAI